MRKAEAGRVLEPVAESSVETNVGRPDESSRSQNGHRKDKSTDEAGHRPNVGVRDIVGDSAHPWSRQIAKKGKIGGKKEYGEYPPPGSEPRIGKRRGNQYRESFKLQHNAYGTGYSRHRIP